MKHDFEYLKNLYIADPVEFKKVTDTILADFIDDLPERTKEVYRAKQWRLEQELKKIHNPLARMNKMVSILWVSLNEHVAV